MIAPAKVLFSTKPCCDASYEYSQHMFSWICKKNIYLILSFHELCQIQENHMPSYLYVAEVRPRDYKLFSCSTQLSMKFVLLKLLTTAIFCLLNIAEHENFRANTKMPTIIGIFIFISR